VGDPTGKERKVPEAFGGTKWLDESYGHKVEFDRRFHTMGATKTIIYVYGSRIGSAVFCFTVRRRVRQLAFIL
jgi:hypothetical protein